MTTTNRIDSILQERGISRRQLARAAGIAPSSLQTALARNNGSITLNMLLRISDVLKVPLTDIAGTGYNDPVLHDPVRLAGGERCVNCGNWHRAENGEAAYGSCDISKPGVDKLDVDFCSQGQKTPILAGDVMRREANPQAVSRLHELASADKDGRTLVMPCRIGEPIYWPAPWLGQVLSSIVVSYSVYVHGIVITDDNGEEYRPEDFGKNVFLSHRDAKAELERKTDADVLLPV